MKKSKIIIPALGMLLLSTAASVTGTVAWFTSVSALEANMNSFAVKRLGGNLELDIKTEDDNSGSTVYGNGSKLDGEAVTLQDNCFFTHGSYNHNEHLVYRPTNAQATTFASVSDVTTDSDPANPTWYQSAEVNNVTYKYYYAVSWTYIFTYTFGANDNNVNLYFDNTNSVVTKTAGETTGDLHTYLGFRMAFVSGTSLNGNDRSIVWADNGDSNSATNAPKYLKTESSVTSASGTYTSPNATNSGSSDLIDVNATNIDIAEGSTGTSTRCNYIGQFTKPANAASNASAVLYVRVIAWFEGTDLNVVNASTLDTVSAVSAFYTRAAA